MRDPKNKDTANYYTHNSIQGLHAWLLSVVQRKCWSIRHPGESAPKEVPLGCRGPVRWLFWIPAFAGMTDLEYFSVSQTEEVLVVCIMGLRKWL